MKIDCGIIGLPNVGKSTLFNVLTNMSAKTANFPFCTIQPNVSVVHILDPRTYQLANLMHSSQIVHGTMEFVDIAGLIKGAAKGEGLGNKTLTYIRTLKVLCHVVRCFDDDQVMHVSGNIDPNKDIDMINTELILYDISQCDKNINFFKKNYKISDDRTEKKLFLLKKCLMYLNDGILLNTVRFSYTEYAHVQKFNFLTFKPIIYVANIGIECKKNIYLNKLNISAAHDENKLVVSCCAKSLLSHNMSYKNHNNNKYVDDSVQHRERILKKIVDNIFYVLNLCTFFTINTRMTRAWIDKADIVALETANKVHSDFKKGFIRVQVIKFNDFINYKGELGVKKMGKIYIEGKNYCIQDGDILKFLFSNATE